MEMEWLRVISDGLSFHLQACRQDFKILLQEAADEGGKGVGERTAFHVTSGYGEVCSFPCSLLVAWTCSESYFRGIGNRVIG